MKNQLHLNTYLNLEKRFISWLDSVLVDDYQGGFEPEGGGVYSNLIADLILSCGASAESLSKDICVERFSDRSKQKNTSGKKNSDNEKACMMKIRKEFNIDEIELYAFHMGLGISNANQMVSLKKNSSGKRIYISIYQSLKHHKLKNIKKATVHNFIHCFGWLYVLNHIYRNKQIYFDKIEDEGTLLEKVNFSEIFSFPILINQLSTNMKPIEGYKKYLYNLSPTKEYRNKFKEYADRLYSKKIEIFMNSEEGKKHIIELLNSYPKSEHAKILKKEVPLITVRLKEKMSEDRYNTLFKSVVRNDNRLNIDKQYEGEKFLLNINHNHAKN